MADTPAATDAERPVEFVRVIIKLVFDALPESLGLHIARVMARCVHREHGELAGIPVLAPGATLVRTLVNDIKAVAGRAEIGAGAAPDAGQGYLGPYWMLKVLGQPGSDFCQVKLLIRAFIVNGFFVIIRKERFILIDQVFAFVADGLDQVIALGCLLQEDVAAFGGLRGNAHAGAEAELIALFAGHGDNNILGPALEIEFVVIVPGKDLVHNRIGNRFAGTHTEKYCFRWLGRFSYGNLAFLGK